MSTLRVDNLKKTDDTDWATDTPTSGKVATWDGVNALSVVSVDGLISEPAYRIEGFKIDVSYHRLSSKLGGGVFVWDQSVDKQLHDGGYIIDPGVTYPTDWSLDAQVLVWLSPQNIGNGCFVRLLEDACIWENFGLIEGTYSGEAFTIPYTTLVDRGYTDFKLPDGPITLTGPVPLVVPVGVDSTLKIHGGGKISFNYAWDWPTVHNEVLFSVTGNGAVSVYVDVVVDGLGMGRYPDIWKIVTGLFISDCPSSDIRVNCTNMFGFGCRVQISDGSIIRIKSYNCDGQKITMDEDTPAFDNYGDGLYIRSRDVTVINPVIETTQGGRGGIVFESLGDPFSGIVISPLIIGYDRNLHIEGGEVSGNVTVLGGKLLNSNESLWNFSLGSVTAIGVTFENLASVSVENQTTSVIGYVGNYQAGGRVTTRNCVFKSNVTHTQAVYSSGNWHSDNDTFESGCGSVRVENSDSIKINNVDFSGGADLVAYFVKSLSLSGRWAGNVEIPGTHNFNISLLEMLENGEFCGSIVATNKKGGIISNVIFNNPEAFCIDNYRGDLAAANPVFEGIKAIRKTVGSSASILRFSATPTAFNYRSSLPSYVVDEVAVTVVETAPRLND